MARRVASPTPSCASSFELIGSDVDGEPQHDMPAVRRDSYQASTSCGARLSGGSYENVASVMLEEDDFVHVPPDPSTSSSSVGQGPRDPYNVRDTPLPSVSSKDPRGSPLLATPRINDVIAAFQSCTPRRTVAPLDVPSIHGDYPQVAAVEASRTSRNQETRLMHSLESRDWRTPNSPIHPTETLITQSGSLDASGEFSTQLCQTFPCSILPVSEAEAASVRSDLLEASKRLETARKALTECRCHLYNFLADECNPALTVQTVSLVHIIVLIDCNMYDSTCSLLR